MRPSRWRPSAAASSEGGSATFCATSVRIRSAVAASWRKSVRSPSEMPHNARSRTSAATISAVSSAPRARSCSTRGASVRRSARRIALEPSASPSKMVKARSARFTAVLLRETAKRGAVRRVDGVELGAEGREGGVAELGNESAGEVAGETRAVLVAGVRGTVNVGLALAGALEKPLVVEADHDRHHRRVGELALRVALLDAGRDRRSLRGVLAEGEGMEEAEPAGIGDPLERRRSALVLFVARALEHGGVAREEV